MKKLFIILISLLSFGAIAEAQKSSTFVQAGISTFNSQISQNLEIGGIKGKNRVSVVGETFDAGSAYQREYFAGIKYARAIEASDALDFLLTGAAKVHLDKGAALFVEPGVGLDLHLSPTVSLIGSVTSPLFQNQAPFNSLNLKGGMALQLKF